MVRRSRQRGRAMLEFALTGVPLIFIWFSTVQLALRMWHYLTLQYAVKAAGADVAVHGSTCVAQTGGGCQKNLSDAATVFKNAAVGIPASQIQVTWTACASVTGTTCNNPSSQTCYLDQCISSGTFTSMMWPLAGANPAGTSEITIRADWVFRSGIAMVAPGPGTSPQQFGSYHFPGYTHQQVLF